MNLGFEEPYRVGKCVGDFLKKHPKLRFAMKVSFFYVVSIALAAQAFASLPAFSQKLDEIQVTVELQNENLISLFNKIEGQTKLLFAYQHEQIDSTRTITLPKSTRSVKELLDIAFQGTSFRYRQSQYSVIIYQQHSDSDNQALTITGTVTDKSGTSLPGVNVIVKGTTTGVATDANGKYSIDANDDDILVFSFIGLKTFETTLNARAVIDVIMEEDVSTLNEVVINGGYYETTDKLKTGSIVKVTSKEIETQPVTSPLMALQGRVAGLDITPTNGSPGSAPTIRIRGNNSLRINSADKIGGVDRANDGNYPLYVIDGVPVNSAPISNQGILSGAYDPLSAIVNPSNIESIEILKDGDATAIYGSRGANGVILITTKQKIKSIDRTNIDINVYKGMGQVSRKVDLLNTREYINMRKQSYGTNPIPVGAHDLTKWDTTRYTDWQDVLLGGTANITDIQGGISSGNKSTSFIFNGGFHKETLVTPGDFGYQRGNGNLTINHTSLNQKFQFTVSANYGADKSESFQGSFMDDALSLPPNAPELYDANGNLNWAVYDFGGGSIRSTWINPMSYLRQSDNKTSQSFFANGNFGYEFFSGFRISTNIGLTNMSVSEEIKIPISSQPPSTSIVYGNSSFLDTKRTSWIIEPKLSYVKKWKEHALNVIIGSTWQQSNTEFDRAVGDEYTSDALLGSIKDAGKITLDNSVTEYKFTSIYGRAGYNFSQRYLLNLTVRRDGSSRFGSGNRFGNFWAVGGAWIFTEESFVKPLSSFLNFGKIRASYGVTGSDNIGDYNYYDLYNNSINTESYQGINGIVPFALFNPEFRWEETWKLESALELSFIESRLSAEISWYRNRSSNQLVNYTLPATTGFSSVLQNFDATIQNTGWEFALRGHVVSSDNLNWTASINLTLPSNKLIEFDGIEDSPYATMYKVGEPLSIWYVYRFKGVNPQTGLYEVEDRNDDGIINDSDRMFANVTGKSVYGGFSNTLQYKGVELSILLQFTSQHSQRALGGSPPGYLANQSKEVLDRWRESGDETDVQRFDGSGTGPAYINMRQSDYMATDASFIRLKTLSLSYQLSGAWLSKANLRQAKVFVQGQNLFTITKYKGLDPETGNQLPPLRMLTLGLQLKF